MRGGGCSLTGNVAAFGKGNSRSLWLGAAVPGVLAPLSVACLLMLSSADVAANTAMPTADSSAYSRISAAAVPHVDGLAQAFGTPAAAEASPPNARTTGHRALAQQFWVGLREEWRGVLMPAGKAGTWAWESIRLAFQGISEEDDLDDALQTYRDGMLQQLAERSADYATGYLSDLAEDRARSWGFVRTVEIDYRSKLGKRRWQAGISALGPLR